MHPNNSELVEGLIHLGMSEREAKVYLALLNKSYATAPTLQKLSRVPQSKIYAILDNLVRSGFCSERKEGRVRTFEAIDPINTLESPINTLSERLKKSITMREKLHEIYKSVDEVKEPFEYIEIVHGNENVHRKFVELLRNVESELLAFTRPPFASKTKAMKEEQKAIFYNYLNNGGESRGVYEVNDNSLPRMFYNVYSGSKIGESLRIVPKLPLKMFIFDRKTLLIADKESLTEESEMTMTVVKQRATVNGYIALFDFFWEQGLTYEQWIKGKERLMEQKLDEFDKTFGLGAGKPV